MLKNIVLAFDGSEYSNRALQYAIKFAERFEAILWLVHIFPHTSDLLGYEDYEKFYSKRKASGQALLDAAHQELSNTRLEVREELQEGPEAESILNVAKNCQAEDVLLKSKYARSMKI